MRLGVADTFGESGSADELLAKHGLDTMGIAAAARQVLKDFEEELLRLSK
ncbi:MAG: hypothetical protein WCI75_02370 [candidate division NC10 bacterium]